MKASSRFYNYFSPLDPDSDMVAPNNEPSGSVTVSYSTKTPSSPFINKDSGKKRVKKNGRPTSFVDGPSHFKFIFPGNVDFATIHLEPGLYTVDKQIHQASRHR